MTIKPSEIPAFSREWHRQFTKLPRSAQRKIINNPTGPEAKQLIAKSESSLTRRKN